MKFQVRSSDRFLRLSSYSPTAGDLLLTCNSEGKWEVDCEVYDDPIVPVGSRETSILEYASDGSIPDLIYIGGRSMMGVTDSTLGINPSQRQAHDRACGEYGTVLNLAHDILIALHEAGITILPGGAIVPPLQATGAAAAPAIQAPHAGLMDAQEGPQAEATVQSDSTLTVVTTPPEPHLPLPGAFSDHVSTNF